MRRKIPEEAFDYYACLGPRRSFRAVAERYGVSRQAVAKRALRDGWQHRASLRDQAAQQVTAEDLIKQRHDMYERNCKLWGVVQAKAVETLRDKPFRTSLDAVRALEAANSALSQSLYLREKTRADLAALRGENLQRVTEGASSGIERLTDNQLLRRAAEFEAALERVRAAKSRPPGANA